MLTQLIIAAAIALMGTDTGIQDNGTYRVTDYQSHVEMCEDATFYVIDRAECLSEADNAWN